MRLLACKGNQIENFKSIGISNCFFLKSYKAYSNFRFAARAACAALLRIEPFVRSFKSSLKSSILTAALFFSQYAPCSTCL